MIGIISAMREEIHALEKELQEEKKIELGGRTYYTGKLLNKEVVLVFSRWGKVASAITTTQLISTFNVSEIIFTGVAGSIQPHINIGDIIIGKNLYQHDVDARPFFEEFEIPIIKKKFLEASHTVELKVAAEKFIKSIDLFIENESIKEFNLYHPNIVIGDIASGDSFISSEEKMNVIKQRIPTALCVEMEGAAVAQVCYEYGIPFSIIRIISDNADDNAEVDFAVFASSIASHFAFGILTYYFA